MKTVILQGDGMASVQAPELEGRTPLEVASTPNLDYLASHGEYGLLTVPMGTLELGGDVSHLALLGYDPNKYYSGPAPFEGASLEIVLGNQDVAYLCHFVHLRSTDERGDTKKLGSHHILDDDLSKEIELEEARELIDSLNEQLASETIQFYTGRRHRHLMVWAGGTIRNGCKDPRTAIGQGIQPYLPVGESSKVLGELMEASRIILRHHPVNEDRESSGKKSANCLWLWGAGKSMEFPKLTERLSISGATVSVSDLHLGIGICAGLTPVNLSDHAECQSSTLQAYAEVCDKVLQSKDFVYLHVPVSHDFDRIPDSQGLVRTIELCDDQVVGPLLKNLQKIEDCRLLVSCNHTVHEPRGRSQGHRTPFILYRNQGVKERAQNVQFHENGVGPGQGTSRDATRLLDRLFAHA